MKNKSIVIFTIIILILIIGFFVFNAVLKKNVIDEDFLIPTDEAVPNENVFELFVPEQAGGDNVFIESAMFLDGGYVVLHTEDGGAPGAVIGASELLPAGITENFLFDIDEEVVEGDVLFAMLHTDDGDGVFNSLLDVPVMNSAGAPIVVKFNIVGEGALENEVKL